MKVYLLTTGQYSDYTVRGVFSSRELAERARQVLLPCSEANEDIQEVELDSGLDGNGNPLVEKWTVEMLREGEVTKTEPSDFDETEACHLSYSYGSDARVHLWGTFAVRPGPDAKEQAVKSADERRLQFIASGEWEREEEDLRRSKADFPSLFSDRSGEPTEPAVCSSLPQPDGSADCQPVL